MPPDVPPETERVARAIAVALGENPDQIVSIPMRGDTTVSGPAWKRHARKAAIHIAADKALKDA